MHFLDNVSNTLNNLNTIDNYSRDINEISSNNLIRSNKTKISEINTNILKSNKSNHKIKKKIKLGKYKPLKFKNIMLLQELEKSNTFRKTQKYLDEE